MYLGARSRRGRCRSKTITMSKTSKQKRLQEIEDQMQLESRESDLNRARSLGVATAFTQVTEISLRGNGDRFLWTILQPAEVVELIHQLAGNIGCHINVRPREDFASWRKWNGESSDFLPSSTHPPQMGVFPPKAEVEFNKQIMFQYKRKLNC